MCEAVRVFERGRMARDAARAIAEARDVVAAARDAEAAADLGTSRCGKACPYMNSASDPHKEGLALPREPVVPKKGSHSVLKEYFNRVAPQ